MRKLRALVFAVLLVVSMGAMPLSAVGVADSSAVTEHADSVTERPVTASLAAQEGDDDPHPDGRPDDPTTTDTIGYVEGYWYDDELPVDDQDNAVVEDDELDAVVYRSMARVEVIRERTFEETVDVSVRTREDVSEETTADIRNVTEAERLHENVRFEALFMVDRDTDAVDQFAALYTDVVGGFYDPETDEIVVVSDTPESPELDELVLAHELEHALQDQYFDLQSFERATRDQATAQEGLIEGDANTIETEYEQRCGEQWDCLPPAQTPEGSQPDLNWGIYFTIFQPYDDGPDYVEYLRQQGGWDAVDDAFENPPASTSDMMYPEEDREPANITIEDRSSDRWERLETEDGPDFASFGEGAMATMLAAGAFGESQQSVVSAEEFLTFNAAGGIDDIQYSQPYTDGWNGDKLVTYTTDAETVDESAYVWRSEWTSEGDAAAFVDGYQQLLSINGGEPVEDRQDTTVIDEGFPGAYRVDHEGTTVTIVRAPSVDELSEIHEGGAESDSDSETETETGAENETQTTETNADNETAGDESGDESDELAGFGLVVALVALLVGVMAMRRR
ncbi:Hvo_1808 family surface protein [Halomontanus rarus]|uniref:Hvo_1808 family surface protein n=1 Tax=Halomontanus rarus TaxID=3034020 RepID=UPI0023E793B6|nr:Hvo_1808 family surface protein [Halovivax sp. TS33]